MSRIEVVQGDVARQDVDAVVNAANTSLLGGGGVDGAIHRAAGPGLLEECRALGGCPTGESKITSGHGLKAPWIIHTVGPVWTDGAQGEDDLLASCYRTALALADAKRLTSIAFPSVSTGAFGFPMDRATKIAVRVIIDHLKKGSKLERVVLVCYDTDAFRIHRAAVDTAKI